MISVSRTHSVARKKIRVGSFSITLHLARPILPLGYASMNMRCICRPVGSVKLRGLAVGHVLPIRADTEMAMPVLGDIVCVGVIVIVRVLNAPG